MSALRECQERVVAAVLRRSCAASAVPGLRPEGAALSRRLAVYRVNARENFAVALESAFPVLNAEMGQDEFRSLAWSYQLRFPSACGNLFEIGRRLPAFLAKRLAGAAEEHLAELSRLEWAVQEAMVAADDEGGIDERMLAGIAQSTPAGVRPRLHPSVRILQLAHPVFDRWRRHQSGSAAGPSAGTAPEYLLVRRARDGVEVHRLGLLDYHCLESVAAGHSLDEIADAALAVADEPDLGGALRHWIMAGVITAIDFS